VAGLYHLARPCAAGVAGCLEDAIAGDAPTIALCERIGLVERRPNYVVTANGGRIMVEGRIGETWSGHIAVCCPRAEDRWTKPWAGCARLGEPE
jgi:hypothetical protein